MLKKVLKGLFDSIRYRTTNPFRFQVASLKPLSMTSNDYLIAKLKHEAHLLEKNIKNHYKPNHGDKRKEYVNELLKECLERELKESQSDIINWAAYILEQFEAWKKQKHQIVHFGYNDNKIDHELSVPSVRFWEDKKPEKSLLYDCIKVAQMAPASCNRQAFKIIILENEMPKTANASALNSSMFESTAFRVFIYYNRNNYTEKYSAAIDAGMFSQNFILEAKNKGLGCCCCYAGEHLEKSQAHYRRRFGLEDEYYCLLTILVGIPAEVVNKPPRVTVESLVDFHINY